ncbi:MAG: TonB family protein [bacterium]|nr:TonB family protein [bacterium]
MITRHIDRSRSTGGGMAISFVVHAGLLLMLGLMMGHQAAIIEDGGEITEIAYIEATYGEDVAAKVKLKQKSAPVAKPEPAGRGVNTDSVMKKEADSKPENFAKDLVKEQKQMVGTLAKPAKTPEPVPMAKPEPKLKQAEPKKSMAAPKPKASRAKPVVAKTEMASPIVQSETKPKALAKAATLDSKAPRPKSRQVIDASKLGQPVKTLQTAEANAPAARSKSTTEAFKPSSGGLKSRNGTVAAGADVLADAGTSQRKNNNVAEAGSTVSSGGSLKSAGRNSSYAAPQSALAPSSGRRSGSSKAIVDVSGPSGGNGGAKKGRKTLLSYGSGSGGGGGGLSSRQRIAEPAIGEVVTSPAGNNKPQKALAEAKLDVKGVNMSITGQIQGRKVLQSSPAEYSAMAKKKGWEGVVAVHFTVLANGRVKDNMYFEQTSVHRDLNQAAMNAIKKFRFAALGPDQAAVEQWGVITIVFKLK